MSATKQRLTLLSSFPWEARRGAEPLEGTPHTSLADTASTGTSEEGTVSHRVI